MITVERKALQGALDFLRGVVSPRTTIPVLATAHLSASGGKLTVTGTDMDVWASVTVPAEGSLGACCPDHAKLLAAVKSGSASAVRLDETPRGLVLRNGSARSTHPLLDAREFPNPRERQGEAATLTVGAAALKAAIAKARASVSTEETRYYLNGALLRVERDGRYSLTSTDGHRLTRAHFEGERDGALPPAIIPTATLDLLADLSGTIRLVVTPTLIEAEADGIAIVSRLIDGTYPEADRVIPPLGNARATFDVAALQAGVEQVAWASSDKAKALGIRIVPGQPATLWVASQDGPQAVAEVPCEALSEVEVGFNAAYVLSFCKSVAVERVELQIESPERPARFVPCAGDDVHVVMPMRIGGFEPAKELADAA